MHIISNLNFSDEEYRQAVDIALRTIMHAMLTGSAESDGAVTSSKKFVQILPKNEVTKKMITPLQFSFSLFIRSILLFYFLFSFFFFSWLYTYIICLRTYEILFSSFTSVIFYFFLYVSLFSFYR